MTSPRFAPKLCEWVKAQSIADRKEVEEVVARMMRLAAREVEAMGKRRFRWNGSVQLDEHTKDVMDSLPLLAHERVVFPNMVALAVKILCERGLSLESALSCLESRASLLA